MHASERPSAFRIDARFGDEARRRGKAALNSCEILSNGRTAAAGDDSK